jgi:hypothetical protein
VRTSLVLLSGLFLLALTGGCRCGSEPLRIHFGPLQPGETRLPDQDLNTRTGTLIYPLNVQSDTDRPVTLQAKLADGATEGIEVSIDENRPILPSGRESIRVVLALPMRAGPFVADIVLFSDDLPGWTRTYELRGTKTDAPLEGRRLDVEPNGVDLGAIRPGSVNAFSFQLVATGDEAVTLEEIRIDPGSGIRIPNLAGDERIEPGATLRVEGTFRCPEAVGSDVFARVQIRSNAENGPVRNFDLRAKRHRAYELIPPRMPALRTYPHQARSLSVEVRASGDPFAIDRVASLEPYFELAEPLPTEPARSVTLKLKLRKGAPTSIEAATGTLRIYLVSGTLLEWPYRVTVLPSIFAQPNRVDFGTVEERRLASESIEREVQIVSLPGRGYEVTDARSENNLFGVRKEHKRNLPWRIVVTLPAGAKRGIYRDRILIDTDDEEVPRIVIPASAVVR